MSQKCEHCGERSDERVCPTCIQKLEESGVLYVDPSITNGTLTGPDLKGERIRVAVNPNQKLRTALEIERERRREEIEGGYVTRWRGGRRGKVPVKPRKNRSSRGES